MATCPDCGATYADDVRVCDVDGTALLPDAAAASLDEDLKPGTEVGEYKVDERIGKGAFGAVYRATHMLIGKRAAIKVLASRHSSSRQTVSRFLSEARAVNQIRHKHIVDIFSFGTLEDGRQYFIMELLEGQTLKAYFKERGALAPEEAIAILRRIARALDAAHKAGIAHRDLKPDNVFLVFDEDGVFPKLLDFGVAKLLDDSVTLHETGTGTPMGTPLYMSPEQWRGKNVDHRSDIFSLGVMAFELLAGERPYRGETPMDLMVKVATEDPPLLSSMTDGVPAGVDAALAKMLASEPDDRPDRATKAIAVIADAYNAAGAGMVTTIEPRNKSSIPPANGTAETTGPGVSQTLEELQPRGRPWLAIGLSAVVIVAVLVGVSMGGDETAPGDAPSPASTSEAPVEDGNGADEGAPSPAAEATVSAAASTTASASATASSSATASAAPPPTPVVPRPVAMPKPKPSTTERPIIPVLER